MCVCSHLSPGRIGAAGLLAAGLHPRWIRTWDDRFVNHAGDVVLHQPLAVRTHKSGRRRDISEHQDLELSRQRRRGGRQEYIDVENDGTDYIEDRV